MSPMRETMQIMHKLKHLVVWSLTVPREVQGEANVAEVGENKGGGQLPMQLADTGNRSRGNGGRGGTSAHPPGALAVGLGPGGILAGRPGQPHRKHARAVQAGPRGSHAKNNRPLRCLTLAPVKLTR